MTDEVVLAVDLGGTSMKGAAVHPDGTARLARTQPTPRDGELTLSSLLALLRELADEARRCGLRPVAAGVVTPGIVDDSAGIIEYASNLGWRNVPLRRLAAAELGMPVAVGHDVRAAGLAESLLGAAHGLDEFALVPVGTGIAAALITGGTTVTGVGNAAGELGHIPVYPGGEQCPCGQRGCLEAYASGAAIARRYLRHGGSTPLTAKQVSAARLTDPIAQRTWHEAVEALALGLAHVTLLLDPALVVIGGGLARAGDALMAPLRTALQQHLAWRATPPMTASTLGTTAGRTGAALLALNTAGIPPQADGFTDARPPHRPGSGSSPRR